MMERKSFFTQRRFPRLWLFAQHVLGCTGAKIDLALRHYSGQRRVLEIGCSAGNIAPAFDGAVYLGIDIDEGALALARKRFAGRKNFSFENICLADLAKGGARFDYVLFAGILHHVSDSDAEGMLADAAKLIAPGGILVLSEPEALRPGDGAIFRTFYRLEQGQFLRSKKHLEALVESAGVQIAKSEDHLVGMSSALPCVARFNLISATLE